MRTVSDGFDVQARTRLCAIAGLALVAALALLHLWYPFDDDQGLFAFGARELAHGARMYADFWDLKQPGIYWYFEFAGTLFGFDEVGVHLFDLLWMLALCLVLLLLAPHVAARPLLIGLAPVACLGPYWAKADPIHLSQVEIVVVLPIALVAWLLVDATPAQARHAWRYALAGALVVVIVAFKVILGAIPAALIGVALLHAGITQRLRFTDVVLRGAVPALAGGAFAASLLLAYLWQAGMLDQTLWVAFTYPRLALAEYAWQPPSMLQRSLAWIWSGERFLLPFALLGAGRELVVRRSRLGWLLAAWLVVGLAAVLAQVLSWWQYHFNLFFVPIGLFALGGLEMFAAWAMRFRHGRRALPVVLCALFALCIGVSMLHKMQRYWYSGPSPLVDRVAYQMRVEQRLDAMLEGRALLARPGALPGRIANLGDPRMFLYADRPAIGAVNGSGYMLAAQWRAATALLERQRPAYIYLGNDTRYIWNHGGEGIQRLVDTQYALCHVDHRRGEWHERRGTVRSPICDAPVAAATAATAVQASALTSARTAVTEAGRREPPTPSGRQGPK